ncbi:MAG: WbqC family protein [Bacteriovorax sp.]|nr:WbqC family protein [Bacteriovorax sp.]
MLLSIHQPSYFPWLGLLDKIKNSEVYMIMDEVSLTDSAFQHRNLFLSADGKSKYLTIPFTKKNYLQRPFKDLEITEKTWQIKHLNFIQNSYKKHPHYKEVMERVEFIFHKDYNLLADVVVDSMKASIELFGIDTKIVYQSQMEYDRGAKKGDLVLELLRAVGADSYLSGTGAQAYLDESEFGHGIELRYNIFKHPVYSQKNSTEFVSGLACLDILFNLGPADARELLLKN